MIKMANRLLIFNSDCELAIANGERFYTPSANIVKMMDDLAFLPAYWGKQGDRVLVKTNPNQEFIESVYTPLELKCTAVNEDELKSCIDLKGEPWGESPKICHWLAKRGMGDEWLPEKKEWYSRKTAREGLGRLLTQLPFLDTEILPQICYSLKELEQKISTGNWFIKAPWSSSGKGLLPIEDQISDRAKEWLSGIFKRQGYVMLEKRLEKIEDFAMHFFAGDEGIEFIGWSTFTTGNQGEYQGNYIGQQKKIEEKLTNFLGEEKIEALKLEVLKMLNNLLPLYRGYFGVDMMIYKDKMEKITVQPCVEINLRYNMGIIALVFSREYLCATSEGQFSINAYFNKGAALAEHLHLQQKYPAVYENNQIKSGYLNLTPITETTNFVASVICY